MDLKTAASNLAGAAEQLSLLNLGTVADQLNEAAAHWRNVRGRYE